MTTSSDFLLFGHCLDYKALGIFNLLQDKAYVHGRKLWLTGASAIHSVLTYKCQGIGEDIECRRHSAADRPHLKFVAFEQFGVVLQHESSEILAKVFSHIDQGFQTESDSSGFVVFPLLLFDKWTSDVEMRPGNSLGNKLLEE